MKIADLHNFVIVAQARSFSRAAEALRRTPAAISASIKRLERDVGQTLFERGAARATQLTSSGLVLCMNTPRDCWRCTITRIRPSGNSRVSR